MAILGRIIKRALGIRQYLQTQYPDPVKYQQHELHTLLRKAQQTEIGRMFGFADILKHEHPIAEFQQRVPIYDYDKIHNHWWYRSLEGEPDVTWPGRTDYFALSSGTSGSPNKYIPVSGDMVKAIQRAGIKQIYSLAAFNLPSKMFQKEVLILGGSTQLTKKEHYYEGDLSGISAMNIPSWFQHFYKPGTEISAQRDWNRKLEEIVENAPNWDLGMICGIPSWMQILLDKIIDRYNLETIHDIWSDLSVYVHGGVAYGPYRKNFLNMMARPLVTIETYIASEGYIAFQPSPGSDMALLLNNGIFFEFIPFNESNFDEDGSPVTNPEVLSIAEVEAGRPYALLMSTCAGSWRYLLGDVIQFTDTSTAQIIITGRIKHFLNLCGEHLSVNNMVDAMQHLEEYLNVTIPEFTSAGISSGRHFAHRWYLGVHDPEAVNTYHLRDELDRVMGALNNDYEIKRNGPLAPPELTVVPVRLFYEWMERRGKLGGQNKFPRVLNKEQLPDWEEFLEAKGFAVPAGESG